MDLVNSQLITSRVNLETHVNKLVNSDRWDELFNTYDINQITPLIYCTDIISRYCEYKGLNYRYRLSPVLEAADNGFNDVVRKLIYSFLDEPRYLISKDKIIAALRASLKIGDSNLFTRILMKMDISLSEINNKMILSDIIEYNHYVLTNNIQGNYKPYNINTMEMLKIVGYRCRPSYLVEAVFRHGTDEMIEHISEDVEPKYQLIGAAGHSIERLKRLSHLHRFYDPCRMMASAFESGNIELVNYVSQIIGYDVYHPYLYMYRPIIPELALESDYEIMSADYFLLGLHVEDYPLESINKIFHLTYDKDKVISIIPMKMVIPLLNM